MIKRAVVSLLVLPVAGKIYHPEFSAASATAELVNTIEGEYLSSDFRLFRIVYS